MLVRELVRIKILVAKFVGMYYSGVGTAGSIKRRVEVGCDIVMNRFKEKV